MRILAVDTATRSCSVAVVENHSILAEQIVVTRQTHAKHLMGMIQATIRSAEINFADLEGFAVSRGPGSFTGLRIGISTVKGLATATGKPVIGVSTLDALAMQSANASYLICSLLDARRGEVYYCGYRYLEGVLKKETAEQLLTPEKLLQGINEVCVFIGKGSVVYRDTIVNKLGKLALFEPAAHHTIRASTVADIAIERLLSGDTDDAATFVPVYLRKSDAEINLRYRAS